jgi:HTH-type transcriptional regulator/antitoxin MqsA
MKDETLCPICGEGHVTDHMDQVETEYKGHRALVPLRYQLCDVCGSDFAGAAEMRANKDALLAFRQSVDGLSAGST